MANYFEQIKDSTTGEIRPVGLRNFFVNEKGNLNIATDVTLGNTSKGKINIESMNDIQLKPGDDIAFITSHKPEESQDELKLRVLDANDVPVEFKVQQSELTLMTDYYDKLSRADKEKNTILDVNIVANTKEHAAANGQPTKGYLKVRAKAIDLRCEENGGIALQPKGKDSGGHMNKVKFEHGGGDGLEFFTMNAEKMSAYTDEYRFNKDGKWFMATRTPMERQADDTKRDSNDSTTWQYFEKADDDFYDNINPSDEVADTNSIIKTANAFNYGKNRHAKITSKGNLEIATNETFIWVLQEETTIPEDHILTAESECTDVTKEYNEGDFTNPSAIYIVGDNYRLADGNVYQFTSIAAPDIQFKTTGDIEITAGQTLKLRGEFNFGSNFNFGETDAGIQSQFKYTKKGNAKDCGSLQTVVLNNSSASQTFSYNTLKEGGSFTSVCEDNITVESGQTAVVAKVSIYDIAKLVTWMKQNNQGPWQQV